MTTPKRRVRKPIPQPAKRHATVMVSINGEKAKRYRLNDLHINGNGAALTSENHAAVLNDIHINNFTNGILALTGYRIADTNLYELQEWSIAFKGYGEMG